MRVRIVRQRAGICGVRRIPADVQANGGIWWAGIGDKNIFMLTIPFSNATARVQKPSKVIREAAVVFRV